MNSEQLYYENPLLWEIEKYGAADQERVATIANKLSQDIRTVLDVGCGNGLFLNYLNHQCKQRFDRLYGVDRSKAALVHVRTDKVRASVDRLPFRNGEFDVVTCMEVLEHLPHPIFNQTISELARIAIKYIFVTVPYADNLRIALSQCPKCFCRFNANYHFRAFNEHVLRCLLEDKGFSCQEVFFVHRQKIVPPRIEVILRLLAQGKRSIFRRDCSPMPAHSVCPACSYSPSAESGELPANPSESKTMGMRVSAIFSVKTSWRWIAAIYRRA